jgi:hypothetical protein
MMTATANALDVLISLFDPFMSIIMAQKHVYGKRCLQRACGLNDRQKSIKIYYCGKGARVRRKRAGRQLLTMPQQL